VQKIKIKTKTKILSLEIEFFKFSSSLLLEYGRYTGIVSMYFATI